MRRNPARPYNSSAKDARKLVKSSNNSGEENTDFIKLGLLIPYLYLLVLLSINCHERAYFECLGIDKKLIQIEPLNNTFLIFTIFPIVAALLPSLNGLIEYKREFWDGKKKSWWVITFLILLILGILHSVYRLLKHFTGEDTLNISYLLTAALVTYNIELDLKRRKPQKVAIINILSWLKVLFIVTGISCVVSYISGNIAGTSDKKKIIKEGRKRLVRNYEKYSIYCAIDSTFGVERTRIYVTESKNDTIIIAK